MTKAIKLIFVEHVYIQGCFYHLSQNTYRKLQEPGLSTSYKGDKDIRLICGMVDVLAFVSCVNRQ